VVERDFNDTIYILYIGRDKLADCRDPDIDATRQEQALQFSLELSF